MVAIIAIIKIAADSPTIKLPNDRISICRFHRRSGVVSHRVSPQGQAIIHLYHLVIFPGSPEQTKQPSQA